MVLSFGLCYLPRWRCPAPCCVGCLECVAGDFVTVTDTDTHTSQTTNKDYSWDKAHMKGTSQTRDSGTRGYFCICTFAQELQTVSNFCHLGVYARRLKLS